MTELAAPMCLSLDLSLACNLACRTCRCPDIDAQVGSPVLSAEAACRAIEEFAAIGGQEVAIYGGEPLLVKHVYDVAN